MPKEEAPATKFTIQQEDCTPNMYNEFLDCNSYLYQIQERENSESISSDGEFNEFKHVDLVEETDSKFINEHYSKLLREKYLGNAPQDSQSQQNYKKYAGGRYIDDGLLQEAKEFVTAKAQDRKYLSKRLVTQNTGIIISRWASDTEYLNKISRQQQNTIDPDAIFGRIDARDTDLVQLNGIFEAKLPS